MEYVKGKKHTETIRDEMIWWDMDEEMSGRESGFRKDMLTHESPSFFCWSQQFCFLWRYEWPLYYGWITACILVGTTSMLVIVVIIVRVSSVWVCMMLMIAECVRESHKSPVVLSFLCWCFPFLPFLLLVLSCFPKIYIICTINHFITSHFIYCMFFSVSLDIMEEMRGEERSW